MEKIATAGNILKSAGDKVSSAGEKLLPASAAVTALGVVAVKTASDFDSSMSQVAAVSGATGGDFNKLRAKACEMDAKTKFSASEAADAMNYMTMAGWKTSDKSIGVVTIATTNANGSMRSLSAILADCQSAFGQLSDSEKASNAEALVGKNAISDFLALMNSAPEDISKLEGAIKNCDGTSEKMAETMQDNLSGQLTILKSKLQELAISFANIMMPAISSLVSALQGLAAFLNKLPEPVKQIILVVALLVALLDRSSFLLERS
ncbi:MAG: phage tail tape measure protein [Erysipelotrichaceae bacterium]|nr:phage tail tape measure protein [Erysipelotrichaceae bacterium]